MPGTAGGVAWIIEDVQGGVQNVWWWELVRDRLKGGSGGSGLSST